MQEQLCSVYAISSLTRDYIYVGLAFDPAVRIDQHQRGSERTTKPYRPFQTLLIEAHPNRALARCREKYLKSGSGKEFLKELRAASRS